jgi:hypothetical protein
MRKEPTLDQHWQEQERFQQAGHLPLRSCYQWGGTLLAHSEGPLIEVVLYQFDGDAVVNQTPHETPSPAP